MIGQLTELALDATFLALTNEQLAWPQKESEFGRLRTEANRLLAKMDIPARIPETQEKYLEERQSLNDQVLERLGAERQRILGDTVALPLFFLHSLVYRAAATAPFGLDWQPDREIIQMCIDDLGLPTQLISHLERELGWVFIRTDTGEPTIAHADVIRAGGSFLQRVHEEFARQEDSIQGNQRVIEILAEVQSDVREFRDEYRQDAHHLTELLQERNEKVVTAVHDIQERLIAAGIGESEAEALTEKDPERFWDRLTRWASGAPWADVAEEALWAALDFVPGGTGVKLGIKVTRAVRTSFKKHKK
jgi:hypothetical protein